jgi:MFS family permease
MQRSQTLWRNPAFVKLWVGQSVSLVGSQVTRVALPLTAILIFHANATQMSFLTALQYIPFLVFGLSVGVWVDRWRRRYVLLYADLGRCLLLLSIPLLAWIGRLSLAQLYITGFFVGVLTVFFDVAYQAFLPSLVRNDQLVAGNSALTLNDSLARIIGTSIGGAIVQLLTAPVAMVVDSLSFLVSSLSIAWIRVREPVQADAKSRAGMISELSEGFRFLFRNRILCSLIGSGTTLNFCDSIAIALYILYLSQNLAIGPALLGVIVAMISVGAGLGTVLARLAAHRFRLQIILFSAIVCVGIGRVLLPLLSGSHTFVVLGVMLSQMLIGFGFAVYNITQISLRQVHTPQALQGRIHSCFRFALWGAIPLGALVGGIIAERLGLQLTLLAGALGQLCTCFWILTPIWWRTGRPETPGKQEQKKQAALSSENVERL